MAERPVRASGRAAAIPKVSSFVIDPSRGLLVFSQPEAPEAGIQVPAGTIEPGEEPAVAAVRETEEETGFSGFLLGRLLDRCPLQERRSGRDELHDRWFFRLDPPAGLPDRWRHGECRASAGSESWIPFDFFWIDLDAEPSGLTPDHHRVLRNLRNDHG